MASLQTAESKILAQDSSQVDPTKFPQLGVELSSNQLNPHINKIAVVTENGLKVSQYSVGQWIRYSEDHNDSSKIGRIIGVEWHDLQPEILTLYSHWSGNYNPAQFRYALYDPQQEDFLGHDEIPESSVIEVLSAEEFEELEEARLEVLEKSRLVNIVSRCISQNGGRLPERHWESVPKTLAKV